MFVSRRRLLQGSLLCAAAMGHGSSPVLAQEPASPPTPDERERLARLAAAFMETYEVPGLSVAIAIKGKPAYVEAFGVADRDAGETLTPQHRFRIASISKPITSTGIFTLVEAGKLRLDQRVFGPNSIFVDDYPWSADGSETRITIEHLLTHTTGGWSNDARDPMFLNKEMNHRELIAWTLKHMPLTIPPGTSFAYSNFGYCILGRVIEKLTGRTYEQYITENVLGRCGITDMRIAGNTLADRAINEVKYYRQAGGDGDPYGMNVSRMDSHGGWIATPGEMTRFFVHIDGFKDTAQLLADDTLRTMSTPTAANPRYAKGLFVNSQNNWWHGGSLPGTETISVRTNADFCWSAFTNTRAKFKDMASSLDRLMWHMVQSVADWHP
jgi:CubicO group peptidase (beta-lactamase class C family)